MKAKRYMFIALGLFIFWSLLAISVSLVSGQKIGGKCVYDEYPGVCEVMRIENRSAEFRFTENSPKNPIVHNGILGFTVPKAKTTYCMDRHEVKPGSRMNCIYQKRSSGTCTPTNVVFQLIEPDCKYVAQ